MAEFTHLLATLDDCWNRIGVKGDGTCPELQKVVHCHNCPVYAAAGQRLFEREPPADYTREWTRRVAEAAPTESLLTTAVVVFRVAQEWLAVDAGVVVEVAESRAIHTIPHRSDRVLRGLVSIRGELHLCVSLGELLAVEVEAPANGPPAPNVAETSADARTTPRWLVVERDCRWVFAVDEVHGVVRFPQSALSPAPGTVARARSTFSRGVFRWDQRDVGYLDDAKLFGTLKAEIG